MSPRDRRQWRLLLIDLRQLLACRTTVCKFLQCAGESLEPISEELDKLDKAIREDEEALAALAFKFDWVDEAALDALTIKYTREDEEALVALAIKYLNGGES